MYLDSISLVNFKNFALFESDFSPSLNCFIGDNGVGKTNILDAIYYLSFCKSFLNASDKQNIKFEEDFFLIQGKFFIDNEIEDITCGLQKDKRKSFRRNSNEYPKLSEHIGLIPAICVSPYDSSIILEGSDIRRKVTDLIISQYDKQYLNCLINYNRILEQRNIILKTYNTSVHSLRQDIDIWDMQLVEYGEHIFKIRQQFTQDIEPLFQHYYNLISNSAENVQLLYKSQLEHNEFGQILKANYQKDIDFGFTTVGIHKDNFEFNISNMPIKRFGSQGQQKTYIISLKLAWYDYIKLKTSKLPLLLLDDIFDKLDKKRVRIISQIVAGNNFGQIFVTDTSSTRMPNILNDLNIEYKILNLPLK